jgi:hypothetical protein
MEFDGRKIPGEAESERTPIGSRNKEIETQKAESKTVSEVGN